MKRHHSRRSARLTKSDKFRRPLITRAMVEPCEPRRLLTGSPTASLVASVSDFGGNAPESTLVADAQGNLYGTTFLGGSQNAGAVFEVPVGGGSPVVIASFDNSNGEHPQGPLTIDSQGNLYGTAESGAGGAGVVFELPAGSQTITDLASFNFTNGSSPGQAVVLDSQGNLFGTLLNGPSGGSSAIFEVAAGTNALSIVGSMDNTTGFDAASGLIADTQGNLFGVTTWGGANDGGAIFELPVGSTTVQTLASLQRSMFNEGDALAIDADGNLYVAEQAGATSFEGDILELPAGSGTMQMVASFNGSDGANPQGSLMLDAAGDLFGITSTGPSGSTVYEVVAGSNTITTLALASASVGEFFDGGLLLSNGVLYGTAAGGGANNQGTIYSVQNAPIAQLAVSAQPADADVQATLSPVQVSFEDPSANVLTGAQANVTVSIASGPNNATLSGTLAEPAQNGVASFDDLSFDKPGDYTLDFTAGSATVASESFTIRPVATQLAVMQQPIAGTAGQTLGALTVEVEDADGNVMTSDSSNVTVALATSPADGTLGGTLTVAAQNGVATFSDLSLSDAGSYTLTATDASLAAATTGDIEISAVPTPPASPPPPTLPPAPPALTIMAGAKPQQTVLDVSGLAIPNHQKANLTIVTAPAGAHMGTVKATVTSGQVNLQNLKLNQAGTYTVQITDPTSNQVQTQQVVVAPAKATGLVFSRQPVNTTVGTQFGVQVEAVDRFGNVVTDDTSTIHLKRTWRTDGPTLGGTLSVSMVNGVADFSDLSLNGKDPFELTAIDIAEGLKVDSRVFLVN